MEKFIGILASTITSLSNIWNFWSRVLVKSLLTAIILFLSLLAPIEIIRLLLFVRTEGVTNIISFFPSYYVESLTIFLEIFLLVSILHHSANDYFIQEKWATIDTWNHVKKTVKKYQERGFWGCSLELVNQKPHAIRNAIAEILYLEIDGSRVYDRTREGQYIRDTAPRLSYINGQVLQGDHFPIEKNGGIARIELIDRESTIGGHKYRIGCNQKDDPENPNRFVLRWYYFAQSMKIEFSVVAEINLDGVISYGSRQMIPVPLSVIARIDDGRIKVDFSEDHLPHYLT